MRARGCAFVTYCKAHRPAPVSSGTLSEAFDGSDSVVAARLVAVSRFTGSGCCSAAGRLGRPAGLGFPGRPGLAPADCFGPDIAFACSGSDWVKRIGSTQSSDFYSCCRWFRPASAPENCRGLRCWRRLGKACSST